MAVKYVFAGMATAAVGALSIWLFADGTAWARNARPDESERVAAPGATVVVRDVRETLEVRGEVRYARLHHIVAPQAGIIESTVLHEGRSVAKGEILVRLSTTDLKQKRKIIEMELESAVDALADARQEQHWVLEDLEISVNQAQDDLSSVQRDHRRAELLLRHQRSSATEVAEARRRVDLAGRRLDLARSKLDKKRKQFHDGALPDHEAAVLRAREALRCVERDLARCCLKAPASGIVLECGEAIPTPGQSANVASVARGDLLCTVAEQQGREIVAQVFQDALDRIAPGAPVRIGPLNDANSPRCEVRSVSLTGSTYGHTRRFEVRIGVPCDGKDLRVGSGVLCRIEVGRAEGALTAPIQYIRRHGESTVCTVRRNGAAWDVPVKTGLTDGRFVEILSGLVEGERVYLPEMQREGE